MDDKFFRLEMRFYSFTITLTPLKSAYRHGKGLKSIPSSRRKLFALGKKNNPRPLPWVINSGGLFFKGSGPLVGLFFFGGGGG